MFTLHLVGIPELISKLNRVSVNMVYFSGIYFQWHGIVAKDSRGQPFNALQ